MQSEIDIQSRPALEVSEKANAFYRLCGSTAKVENSDTIVFATRDGEMVGIVRLCNEYGFDLLRTMRVHGDFQRKGIGLQILKHFREVVKNRGISKLFCLAYAHLESFYGSIGFKKIETAAAPVHLQERLRQTQKERPTSTFILMST